MGERLLLGGKGKEKREVRLEHRASIIEGGGTNGKEGESDGGRSNLQRAQPKGTRGTGKSLGGERGGGWERKRWWGGWLY